MACVRQAVATCFLEKIFIGTYLLSHSLMETGLKNLTTSLGFSSAEIKHEAEPLSTGLREGQDNTPLTSFMACEEKTIGIWGFVFCTVQFDS